MSLRNDFRRDCRLGRVRWTSIYLLVLILLLGSIFWKPRATPIFAALLIVPACVTVIIRLLDRISPDRHSAYFQSFSMSTFWISYASPIMFIGAILIAYSNSRHPLFSAITGVCVATLNIFLFWQD